MTKKGNLEVVSSQKTRLPIVAIDGPAGAGKSTAARLLALHLGFSLIDTGAIYRCLAYQAIEKSIDLDNEEMLALLCENLKVSFAPLDKSHCTEVNGLLVPQLRVYCEGVDVSKGIRNPEMGMAASNVSKLPKVRAALLELQKSFGHNGAIVMEGRDIGTVIFPKAEIKFFLTASIESRALRRQREFAQMGVDRDLEKLKSETLQRDDQDTQRAAAPLKQADDAILIDSSNMTLDVVVAKMSKHVREYIRS